MKKLITIECEPTTYEDCSKNLLNAIKNKYWVHLLPKISNQLLLDSSVLPKGPGLIISSGGSAGGPHLCLHPCSNLDQSAIATGRWLKSQNIEPQSCRILNPLPMHHVSGLMPWWRSRNWGAEHKWILPSLMKDPIALEKSCRKFCQGEGNPLIISLVPIQLKRLLDHPAGIRWLQDFEVVWIGGTHLPEKWALLAREEGIKLAPCYGATETTAMVTALAPHSFLAGQTGCGSPLEDVELCLNKDGALKIKTTRIARARIKHGHLEQLLDTKGWWQTEDAAELTLNNSLQSLVIIGRMDTAIHSGGETIFPESLELRLIEAASAAEIPIEKFLLLPVDNQDWGERLVALVRLKSEDISSQATQSLIALKELVKEWQPAERPFAWYLCNELETSATGKWDRSRWREWLKQKI